MSTLVQVNGTWIPASQDVSLSEPEFQVVKHAEQVPARIRLLMHERQLMREIGYGQDAAIAARGPWRDNDSGYHRNRVLLDPYTHEPIDLTHRAYPHVYGLCAQFAVTVVAGNLMYVDESGIGDDADDGPIEDKANSYSVNFAGNKILPGHHLRVPRAEYARKTATEWYNEIWLDLSYCHAIILGCISRARFHEQRQPINYGYKDNWYVDATQLDPYVAVMQNNEVHLYQLNFQQAETTSEETGYGKQLVRRGQRWTKTDVLGISAGTLGV